MIYLPLLGTERGIDAGHIGALLTARSLSALVVRIFFVRILRFVGRRPLTLTSMLMSGATFALLAAPFPLSVLYGVIIVLGAAIGIASTLTLSGIMEVAPPGAHATALTMRLTGNRIGQAVIPLLASGVAAATGRRRHPAPRRAQSQRVGHSGEHQPARASGAIARSNAHRRLYYKFIL